MINAANVLRWFTGKARANATAALELLNASIVAGGWLPKASGRVHAAMNKSNVTTKLAHKNEALKDLNHYMVDGQYVERLAKLPNGQKGVELYHNLCFGSYLLAQKTDFAALFAAAGESDIALVLIAAREWVEAMAPVAAAIRKLDATRPVPTFTTLGVSPTVTRTLTDLGVAGTATTVRVCPIRWEERQEVDQKTGRVRYFRVGFLNPPAGTVFEASRHAHGSGCHACGHAIRNQYNWCPLLVDDAAGTPYLLMVGRDCAQSLFGIKMTGDLELASDAQTV